MKLHQKASRTAFCLSCRLSSASALIWTQMCGGRLTVGTWRLSATCFTSTRMRGPRIAHRSMSVSVQCSMTGLIKRARHTLMVIRETATQQVSAMISNKMGKSMFHSSTCSRGSWELPVEDGTQKQLNYWSSDWKYRLGGFHLHKPLIKGTTPTFWGFAAAAHSQGGQRIALMETASL